VPVPVESDKLKMGPLFASRSEIAASKSDMRSRMPLKPQPSDGPDTSSVSESQLYRHSQRDQQRVHRFQRDSHPPSLHIVLRKLAKS
jgi:hypothetical protein